MAKELHTARFGLHCCIQVLLAIALGLAASGASAQPYGLNQRENNVDHFFAGYPESDPTFPQSLSAAPWLLTLAAGGSATGVLPYDVIVPLWADFTSKTRFLAVPGLQTVTYQPENSYTFPLNTLLIKNFYLEFQRGNPATSRPIETRMLIYRGSGEWSGYSYEWNAAGTDANLLANGAKYKEFVLTNAQGTTFTQAWRFPSRTDCLRCHTPQRNTILGFETVQLNRDFGYALGTDNQLRTLEHIGLFDAPLPALPEALPRLRRSDDNNASLTDRAKSYLHANCSMCHLPGGNSQVDLDLRWQTPLEAMKLVDEDVWNKPEELGEIIGLKRIVSGHPELSSLYLRMHASGNKTWRMPPLARTEIDPVTENVIFPWIYELGGVVFSRVDNWWATLD